MDGACLLTKETEARETRRRLIRLIRRGEMVGNSGILWGLIIDSGPVLRRLQHRLIYIDTKMPKI